PLSTLSLHDALPIYQRFLDLSADDVDAGRSLQTRIELTLFGAVVNREDTAFARRCLCERELRPEHIRRNGGARHQDGAAGHIHGDRKSTRLNSSHVA